MRLVYIYHSGFVVEAEGFSILIDYFKDTNPDPAAFQDILGENIFDIVFLLFPFQHVRIRLKVWV